MTIFFENKLRNLLCFLWLTFKFLHYDWSHLIELFIVHKMSRQKSIRYIMQVFCTFLVIECGFVMNSNYIGYFGKIICILCVGVDFFVVGYECWRHSDRVDKSMVVFLYILGIVWSIFEDWLYLNVKSITRKKFWIWISTESFLSWLYL